MKLREGWFQLAIDPSLNMDAAGVHQWSIEGVGVYIGKAKVLSTRLRAYPRNVIAMMEGRPWHGNPLKEYRKIHKALCKAHDNGTVVTVTVLEICDPSVRAEREGHWIRVRRAEAEAGGANLLNSN
jgi:hypothetical protein